MNRNIAVAWRRDGRVRVWDGVWMDLEDYVRKEKDEEVRRMIVDAGSVLGKFLKEDGK